MAMGRVGDDGDGRERATMVIDNDKQCGKGRVTRLDVKLARLPAAEYLLPI